MHVSSAGTSLVEGHSCMCKTFRILRLLFRMYFTVVVFLVVGMCSCDGTLCGFWWVRVNSERSFPATLSLRCSVFLSIRLFVVISQWKDSWREQHNHHASRRKETLPETRRAQAGQTLQRAPSRRSSKRIMNKPVEKMCRHSASFEKIRTQMHRMFHVPRVDVVRKCLLICSEQEQANRTTHDHHRMCL